MMGPCVDNGEAGRQDDLRCLSIGASAAPFEGVGAPNLNGTYLS